MSYTIEIALLILAFVMFGFFYYLLNRDAARTKQIRSIAYMIEDIQREMHSIEKRLSQELEILSQLPQPEPTSSISDISEPIFTSLDSIASSLNHYKDRTESRLKYLEERLRNLSHPAPITNLDDDKILERFRSGMSVDEIAKDLKISKSEIDFVLKINQLR